MKKKQAASVQPPSTHLLDKYHGDEFSPLYTATVCVSGGVAEHGRASGHARSDDGLLAVDLRLPAALGGPGGGTNPEQLFAAGYAACFHGALNLLAARAGISIVGSIVEVVVTFGRDPADGLFALTTDLRVKLPGVDRRIAEELVRNTERISPYAKMARASLANSVRLDPPSSD
jgi:Ohr subfamily peroxiredoxin